MKLFALLLISLSLFSQMRPDFQVRPVYHTQFVPEQSRIGFASWGILPDITNKNPFKCWSAVGVALKGKTRWLEVMGGAGHFYPNAAVSPVLDIRMQDTSIPRLKLFLEVFYPTRRTAWSPSITTPLTLRVGRRRAKLWVGGEADLWWGLNPTKGGGPKIVIPIGRHFAATTTYHFNTNVVREYLVYTF